MKPAPYSRTTTIFMNIRVYADGRMYTRKCGLARYKRTTYRSSATA